MPCVSVSHPFEMPFADTHAHLHFPDYDADRDEVIHRAQAAGVEFFVNVGTDYESSLKSIEIAESRDIIFASAGIHPNDVSGIQAADVKKIAGLLSHPKVIAIGEVGLDFYRDHAPHDKQKEILRLFIQLHYQSGKPLILHCRDAYPALVSLLKEEQKGAYGGIVHCFSSDRENMFPLLDLGFHISFAGPLTYKKNDPLREACKACPPDRLLLETDAPFLPPQSMRGKRNEPAYMIETAHAAAAAKGISVQEIGEITTRNARQVFRLC